MKKLILASLFASVFLFSLIPCFAQFTEEEIAERPKWEEFLLNANIIKEVQIKSEAVTNPWHLTLELDGVTNDALWKDVQGRVKGYIEGWKYEIAAYREEVPQQPRLLPVLGRRRNDHEGQGREKNKDAIHQGFLLEPGSQPAAFF